MNDRPGCLSGLFKLFLLDWVFDALQSRVGFGRGGCVGCGCGFILLIISTALACSIFLSTDWFKLGLHALPLAF